MIDIDTHNVLDMIPSRDYEDVRQWLKTYSNLQVVSRDGSITYHNAINDAHPEAIQVSDRFHLLKNLTSYAKDYLKKELGQHILISKKDAGVQSVTREVPEISKADENRKLTLKEKYEQIVLLLSQGKNKIQICRCINMDVRTYDKLLNMTPEERDSQFQTKMMAVHEEKVQQKIERVNEVKELKRNGYSDREISRRTNLNTSTIKKYLDINFSPVHASYGKKKSGKLLPYLNEINSNLEQGKKGPVIEAKIRECGYDGSSSTLRHYMTDWKRRRKSEYDKSKGNTVKTETVERKDVFKLLYHSLEKVKSITDEQFNKLRAEYPSLEKIHNIVWTFRKLFDDKNETELSEWVERAKMLEVREIDSFINGIERDLEAVKNAIKYEYNNGLAEGSVNKLKVIKRIMYGRCSFETLRTKTLRLEKMRKIN